MVRSGASGYVAVGWESTFGGGASNIQLFGKDQKLNGVEYSNGMQALPQLYTPEIKDFLFGKNSGGCSIEYVLSNPFQFTSILHEPISEILVAGITTRTWSSDPTINGNIRKIKSMHLEVGSILSDENVVRNAKGVLTQSLNLKMGIDQPVQVTQQLVWGIEDAIGTTLNASLPNDSGFTPYNFVQTTVEMPDGTVIATIQDMELTFNINTELLYGLGNANAVDGYRKLFEITGKMNLAFKNKTHLEQVRNRTEIANMEVTISNGLTGTSLRSIVFTFTGVGISRHGVPTVSPTEVMFQEFDFQCRSINVVSKDATAAFTWL